MTTTDGASSPSARLNTPETSPDTQQSETSQVVHTLAEINRNMNKMSMYSTTFGNNRRTNIVLFNNQTLKNRGEAQTNAVDRFFLRPQPTVMTTIIKATMGGRNHIKPAKLQGVKSAMLTMTA